MMTIYADEIQPGDVLQYNGCQHQIIRIERRAGWAWPIGIDATGWAIALGHHPIDVQRIAVFSAAQVAA